MVGEVVLGEIAGHALRGDDGGLERPHRGHDPAGAEGVLGAHGGDAPLRAQVECRGVRPGRLPRRRRRTPRRRPPTAGRRRARRTTSARWPRGATRAQSSSSESVLSWIRSLLPLSSPRRRKSSAGSPPRQPIVVCAYDGRHRHRTRTPGAGRRPEYASPACVLRPSARPRGRRARRRRARAPRAGGGRNRRHDRRQAAGRRLRRLRHGGVRVGPRRRPTRVRKQRLHRARPRLQHEARHERRGHDGLGRGAPVHDRAVRARRPRRRRRRRLRRPLPARPRRSEPLDALVPAHRARPHHGVLRDLRQGPQARRRQEGPGQGPRRLLLVRQAHDGAHVEARAAARVRPALGPLGQPGAGRRQPRESAGRLGGPADDRGAEKRRRQGHGQAGQRQGPRAPPGSSSASTRRRSAAS